MKEKNRVKIIIGILSVTASLASFYGGSSFGKNRGQEQQNKYVQSQVANVAGDNNTVTINNVDDLVNQYNKLLSENETLKAQNEQYFTDYTSQKDVNNTLTAQLEDSPTIEFRNLGLCIDGTNIPISSDRSEVVVNGREYVTKDFIDPLLEDNRSVTIKDNILYIGKIISDPSDLSKQWIVDSNRVSLNESCTDSYGNTYSDAIYIQNGVYEKAHIYFNLDGNYQFLKFGYAPSKNANLGDTGKIVIKADNNTIYTSEQIAKTISSQNVVDIPINNCSLLSIEYDKANSVPCIIFDATVYN